MKKYFSLGILLMLVISTFSVSSTVNQKIVDISVYQDELQHDYNDVFTSLMKEGQM